MKGFDKFLANNTIAEPVHYATTALFGIAEPVRVYQRIHLPVDYLVQGPALITETVSTTFIEPGWQCHTDAVGNLLLETCGE